MDYYSDQFNIMSGLTWVIDRLPGKDNIANILYAAESGAISAIPFIGKDLANAFGNIDPNTMGQTFGLPEMAEDERMSYPTLKSLATSKPKKKSTKPKTAKQLAAEKKKAAKAKTKAASAAKKATKKVVSSLIRGK